MGHGDELVIADANFPSASVAHRLVRADGLAAPALLKAILELFPLDTFVEHPVAVMQVVRGHHYVPVIWDEYQSVIKMSGEPFKDFEYVERFDFYDRAKKAYAVLATGETALYANIVLKKGVIVAAKM